MDMTKNGLKSFPPLTEFFSQMLFVEDKIGVGYPFHGSLKVHDRRFEGWDVS